MSDEPLRAPASPAQPLAGEVQRGSEPPADDRAPASPAQPSGGRFGRGAEPPSEVNLRVDVNGDWFDGDEQVTHPGILANLRGNLRKDAGGYFIQTRVRIPVQVEDRPFVVIRVEPAGDRLRAVLNDGTEETVDPATIRIGRGDVPYCPVRGGEFEARLSRAAAFQLLTLAEYDEQTGRGALRLGGREYPLRRSE